jgi:hypothetical protein
VPKICNSFKNNVINMPKARAVDICVF